MRTKPVTIHNPRRVPGTDEYKVSVRVGGWIDENRTYYSMDREDAEQTRLAMIREAILNGENVQPF